MIKKAALQGIRELFFILMMPFDLLWPKQARLWMFATHPDYPWCDNIRNIFEKSLEDPDIHPVLLVNDDRLRQRLERIYADQECSIVRRYSLRGIHLYLKSKIVFISYTNKDLYSMIFPHFRHIIINLWHGIPVKTISLAQPRHKGLQRKLLNPFYTQCDYLISSSDIDRLAMSASMMHNFNDVWVTGLPRNDYLSTSERLPQDLLEEETALLKRLDGRKLLLYAPTFREWADVSNPLSDPANLQKLTQVLREQGFVLGLRLHPMDNSLKIDGQGDMLDCGGDLFSNPQVVLRHTSCLVTDYSSIWTDFLLTGRPIVGFVYDYDRYMAERAMLYDLEKVFPGRLNKTFDGFLQDVAAAMGKDQDRSDQYAFSRKLFFKYLDSSATQRVLDNARGQAGL